MIKKVYIKNVDSDSLILLKSLQKLGKTIGMNKDTFTIKDVSNDEFNLLLEIQQNIEKTQNKKILITQEQ
tara:strand:- start:3415 stop:3624 length:210 start_codon:yes stop_codon:yes gene_type:complete